MSPLASRMTASPGEYFSGHGPIDYILKIRDNRSAWALYVVEVNRQRQTRDKFRGINNAASEIARIFRLKIGITSGDEWNYQDFRFSSVDHAHGPVTPWMGVPNNSIREGSWNPSPQVARTVSESSNGCQRTPNFGTNTSVLLSGSPRSAPPP